MVTMGHCKTKTVGTCFKKKRKCMFAFRNIRFHFVALWGCLLRNQPNPLEQQGQQTGALVHASEAASSCESVFCP
eukprot:5294459-Amphidinium_carterae.1